MMNRRDALSVLTAGAAGSFGTFDSTFARLLHPAAGNTQTGSGAPSGEKSQDKIDDLLRKDIARLAPKEYSEEGIPVLLACEDLVANKRAAALSPLNAAIASQFRRNAAAWERIRQDAPASDVSKLIEVLADRDFANGGEEKEPANSAPTFTELAYTLAEEFATHPLIRAVNFHNTSRAQAEQYERQIARYSQYFSSVNQDELEAYLMTGEWHKAKPGLIVSVFEGYRNSYDVLVPLLEKHGFVAWFFMITGFINAPVVDQRDFAEHHDIDMLTHEYPDGRYALTWDELRQLDKKHVIASHTRSHTLLSKLDPAVQRQEVIGAQEDFKKNLGHPVRAFVSLTGPAYGENQAIDELIDAAGYGLVFSNFRVQRIRAK
ncbi:MAG: polysaccharide deacetylase family protein [Terriglobales bacterium]